MAPRPSMHDSKAFKTRRGKRAVDLKKMILARNLRKGIKKHKDSYKVYIYKVLKQVQHDVSISSRAVGVTSANELCECIAFEASRLAHYNKRSTISRREIQKSIQMLLSALSLIDIKQQNVECVFAGSGRYGYGKKETKMFSKQAICKRLKAYCVESREKKRTHIVDDMDSPKHKYLRLKEYLRVLEKKMRRREKYLKWQEVAGRSI
eukprot:gene1562-16011_t